MTKGHTGLYLFGTLALYLQRRGNGVIVRCFEMSEAASFPTPRVTVRTSGHLDKLGGVLPIR